MDSQRIATLLKPFVAVPALKGPSFRAGVSPEEAAVLSQLQLQQISSYLDLLLRWNSRVNLTAVREPDAIITRHFGESLFTARHLFPSAQAAWGQPPSAVQAGRGSEPPRVFDFGSGAGFPGLPIKIWTPHLDLTLIESNQKKAAFLREVIRKLSLNSAAVFFGRAEDFHGQADVVTLRAVERFESSVPVAARLVAPEGRLALLIGEAQVARTRDLIPNFRWHEPLPIPLSSNRVLLIGSNGSMEESS
jgi:16S rRNA (guanine527-N7)-methyltransferase